MLLMSSKCLSVISWLVSLNQNTSFVHERHHEWTIQQLLSLMFTLKSRSRCECYAVINMVLNPSAGGGGLTVYAGILMDIILICFLSMEQSQVSHTCRTSSSPSLFPSGTSTPHGWQHAPTSCLYGCHASPEEWCPWHVMAGNIGHVTYYKVISYGY